MTPTDEARVEAIADVLETNAAFADYEEIAARIIAADPVTAEYERAVAGKAHWEQREADNWVQLEALTAEHAQLKADVVQVLQRAFTYSDGPGEIAALLDRIKGGENG